MNENRHLRDLGALVAGLRLSCMVLDESQMIKNRQSKTSKAGASSKGASGG